MSESSPAVAPPLVLEGLLVAAPTGRVRLLMGAYCLELSADDVIEAAPLAQPDGVRADRAVAARLTLMAGARLWRFADAAQLRASVWHDVGTFAVAARPQRAFTIPESFRRREAEFYEQAGIGAPGDPDRLVSR